MEEFWKQFKEEHPFNKSLAAVSIACGDKWNQMSDVEKASYVKEGKKRMAVIEKSWMLISNEQLLDLSQRGILTVNVRGKQFEHGGSLFLLHEQTAHLLKLPEQLPPQLVFSQ
ncbi:High mobility group B protein 3 [Capsicum baccatum]|uniref:High mobility group B protein 3 n=1 Tax=Capsicum baccatum TaxID=33114 RepID=A0A2G2XCE4_CAPBA|nr:High mobility group B protein 3 [Capsicum baccatum]